LQRLLKNSILLGETTRACIFTNSLYAIASGYHCPNKSDIFGTETKVDGMPVKDDQAIRFTCSYCA